MATNHYTRIALGLTALGTMASCSLPPKEAWRHIQTEGLIPYVAREVRGEFDEGRPAPTRAVQPNPSSAIVQAKPTTPPAPSIGLIGPERPSVPPPSQLATASLPVAKPVEGLAGYVRSPYTNPPRLVDVRGMTTGSKVVCPYTRKPFIVPSAGQIAPQNVAAAPATPTPTPAPLPKVEGGGLKPLPQPQLPPSAFVKEPPTQPTKVAANTAPAPTPPPTTPAPSPAPQTKPMTEPTKPGNAAAGSTPAPVKAPAAPAANEIPFGTAIAGRPGFVNSPFAAKHQLVDVTGLPTGMEVKCPYTGKLFRVPPQANEPAPATKPNP